MRDLYDQPRSFRLSRGHSDLWLLLFAFILGAIIIVNPAAATWIMRAMLIALAILLLIYIKTMRRLRGDIIYQSQLKTPLGALVGIAVLGIWIWFLIRGFLAGRWVDASLMSVIVAAFAYIEWLKAHTP